MKYRLIEQRGWIGYKFDHVYDTNEDSSLERHVSNYPSDWERVVEDEFVVPEKWYLKVTEDNRSMATEWRDSMCAPTYRDWRLVYGWYILSKHHSNNSYYSSSSHLDVEYDNYTEITTEQFIKYIYNPKFKSKTTMTTQKLTVPISDVLRIHSIACSTWKSKIATEYLPRVNSEQQIEFTPTDVNIMFKAATESQLPVLEEIFGKRSEPIQWDRIKTGSKVMIKYTGEHCNGIEGIDTNKPVDVVFFKTPHFINYKNLFHKSSSHLSYCTFYQDGKYALFSADSGVDYITRVIEY